MVEISSHLRAQCKIAEHFPIIFKNIISCNRDCLKRLDPVPELKAKGLYCAYQKNCGFACFERK